MKWLVVVVIVFFSFSFLYSFFNKKKLTELSNYSKSIYDYSFIDIDGNEVSLSNYKNKKIMIVNVASKCGYTSQYRGLQDLHEKYIDKIQILGFPSNDFLWQEPGKNKDIKKFCTANYGVTFKMSEKIVVKKKQKQSSIYTWLSHAELNGWNDKEPSWNFCKYLINENGELVHYYTQKNKPLSEEIINFINE